MKSSSSGIKLGRTNHSARAHLVRTENLHRTRCTYKTREKTCKNRLQITKRKPPKLKGTLHKPQILLPSTAALLQCRKNQEVSVLFALPRAQEGEPGKGSKLCAVFPPHLLRPPDCTPRRNAPQADSPHRLSEVLCCHRGPGVSVPSLSSHAGLSLSLTRNFLKQLLSPSRKPSHRAGSGLTPRASVPSQAMTQFVPSLSHPKFQEPDCTSHT